MDYETFKALDQTKTDLFDTMLKNEHLQAKVRELELENLYYKEKFYEHKSQVMHLNRALAKTHRKNRALNERVQEYKASAAPKAQLIKSFNFNGKESVR